MGVKGEEFGRTDDARKRRIFSEYWLWPNKKISYLFCPNIMKVMIHSLSFVLQLLTFLIQSISQSESGSQSLKSWCGKVRVEETANVSYFVLLIKQRSTSNYYGAQRERLNRRGEGGLAFIRTNKSLFEEVASLLPVDSCSFFHWFILCHRHLFQQLVGDGLSCPQGNRVIVNIY